MKRLFAFLIALMLLATLACPVLAADTGFMPSVGDKGAPELVPVGDDTIGVIRKDEEVIDHVQENCLIITPVSEADTSTDIPEAARDELKKVYKELLDGTAKLPYDQVDKDLDPNNMVIRDLFDASFLCQEHPEMLEPEGSVLDLTFKLGVDPFTTVYAFTYINGQWVPAEAVVNNGDGTITVTFEQICPIAFSVNTGAYNPPSQTGDAAGNNLWIWAALLLVSAGAIVTLVVMNRRKSA